MQEYRYDGDINNGKHYDEIVEADRSELLTRQFKLIDSEIPVVIVISGMVGSGKSEIINLLNEWMDTRFIETHVHRPPSDEEADRPYFWKYWRRLPGEGETGLFLGSWYTQPWLDHIDGSISKKKYLSRLQDIVRFEELLAADGTLIIKIRLELTEKQQIKRIKATKNRPAYSWRMSADDMDNGYPFEKKKKLADEMMEFTDLPHAPWFRVDASQPRRRNLSVMHLLTTFFDENLKRGGPDLSGIERPNGFLPSKDFMAEMDLTPSIDRPDYTVQMEKLRKKIFKNVWKAHQNKRSLVCVFEGADAAGKGGSIRRLIRAVDARLFRVIQIAAPKGREKTTHYLHRFWRRIPRAGFVTIYDRSWYGRVLVERVEGFATEEEWKRAYAEINQFEKELTDAGVVVLKFWLEISADEQLKRFKAREVTEHKKFKITDDDWRNREKRTEYQSAINDMVERTSTDYAPWHLIPAEDKKFARVEVLRLVHDALKKMK
ncbi:MAG: polyphosphate:AMP phosphotransferase [Balneolaceae bacterium]|jgi:polyphosphate:AMP phosphotransferase|nr:MAG: polyphosphate:AMP phosphotransferase [Balneolaceae bacterium]